MVADFKYAPKVPEPFRCRVPLPDTYEVIVTNGEFREEHFSLDENVLTITRRKGGIKKNGAVEHTQGEESERGYFVEVKEGSVVDETIQIIGVRDGLGDEAIEFVNGVKLGRDSGAKLLLCNHSLTTDRFETEEAFDVALASGAQLDLVVMQNEHNKSTHKTKFNISLNCGARLKIVIVALHGGCVENDITVNLKEEGAICDLNGTYLMDGTQRITTSIKMAHIAPGCMSSQLFKGILDDEAIASFTGNIVVERDAQKTEAYQANHNLLISPDAKGYTQPQLEIYADDVKCSHGATSGRLDDMALFYMRSRGIGNAEAKLLQQLAFVYDVLGKIGNEKLHARLHSLVESRLRGEFARCNNCSMHCC
jgi:ABC-type transport system involved in Fe-S cluster assembly, permease component